MLDGGYDGAGPDTNRLRYIPPLVFLGRLMKIYCFNLGRAPARLRRRSPPDFR